MPTFRLQYLTNPKILRSIETRRLRALLAPHRDYFQERGLDLCPRSSSPLDLENLIGILSAPTSETPQRLLDSLFLINELSTPQGMDALLAAAERACIPLDIDDRQSPADVAVQVWLHSPAVLEQQHARVMLVRPRRFDSFQGQFAAPAQPLVPSPKQLKAIEHDLDNLYEAKRRGRGTRVFHYPAGEETRFLIRRGEPYRRDEALEDEGIVSLYYRPLRYDVVIYDWRINELRINTSMPSAKPVYCRAFGKHLFGDPDRFPGMSKYTLQPLLDLGDVTETETEDTIQIIIQGITLTGVQTSHESESDSRHRTRYHTTQTLNQTTTNVAYHWGENAGQASLVRTGAPLAASFRYETLSSSDTTSNSVATHPSYNYTSELTFKGNRSRAGARGSGCGGSRSLLC